MHRRSTARRRQTEGGFMLIAVVMIALLLGGLSAGFLSESLAEKTSVDLRQHKLVAMQVCEQGVARATLEVVALHDATGDGIGTVSGIFADGDYDVVATQDASHPDRWTLDARGIYQGARVRIEVGLRRREAGDYVEGLFAKDTLTFNGKTSTDAYDSRLGSYASQAVNSDGNGTYAEGGGHVGSNQDIVLHGSSVAIRGNAIPGPNHGVSVSGSPTIWGDVVPRRQVIDIPPASYEEFAAALANNDNDSLLPPPGNGSGGDGGNGNGNGNGNGVNGNGGGGNNGGAYDPDTYELRSSSDVVLEAGTYFFTSVRLTGQAKLVLNGAVTIYVTGDFDISGGGMVNQAAAPASFKLFAHPYAMAGATPSSSQIKIRGGSQAALVAYAPGAQITVAGNDDVYGALIGETITVAGNSRFHYDKALKDLGGHGTVYIERLYWRDLDQTIRP
jgi:hypothetical protein